MDIDDYLNLQSHSDGSIHDLQDMLSPTHDSVSGSISTGTNTSTMDVTKTMATSDTTTPTTTPTTAAATATEAITNTTRTENEASLVANYPIYSTTTPNCWGDQMALSTNDSDASRLFAKSIPDVEQFLYTFGGGNSGISATSNWNVLAQHQNQHGLSMTPTPLTDLATIPGGLPDFLAPHCLTLTDMEKAGEDVSNASSSSSKNDNNNNNSTIQQTTPRSVPTTVMDIPEDTGMVTRSKRQKRVSDVTAATTTTVSPQAVVSTVTPPNSEPPPASPPKKKRAKKLYCICQKPYDGQPMVQCDECKQWFHCSCLNLDADEMENMDWMCDNCKTDDSAVPDSRPLVEQTTAQNKNKTSTRQSRHRHTCLLSTCNNHTRANSYCSDVCARLDTTDQPQDTTRKSKTTKRRDSADSVGASETNSTKRRRRSATSIDSSDTDSAKNDSDYQAIETTPTIVPPAKKTTTVDPVRKNVLKPLTTTLTPILTEWTEQLPEALQHQVSMDPLEAAESLAMRIEGAIFDHLGDHEGGDDDNQSKKLCGSRYKTKVRSLLYNLRDKANKEFQLRVARGDLTPDQLATMSSEDMANPTLKSMSESLREKSIKNSVLKTENIPIIKKTHKGDIIMIPRKDDHKRSNNDYDSPASSSSKFAPTTTTTTTTNTDGSNYTRKMTTGATKTTANAASSPSSSAPSSSSSSSVNSSTVSDPRTSSSTTHTPLAITKDKMDAIWKQIGITKHNDGTQQHKEHDTSKSKKPSVDLEALLGEEDDDVQLYAGDEDDGDTTKDDHGGDTTIVWKGRVEMPEVAAFDATARQIGGRVLTKAEWQQILSPSSSSSSSMFIQGRIPVDTATKYISSMRHSSSRELVILEMECQTTSGSNIRHMQTLLNYFDSLKRYGVVSHDKTKVKDFYLFPLSKSQRIPDALYVVPEEERQREADLFLGVLVIPKQQQKKQQQQQQQQQQYQPHGSLASSSSSNNSSSSFSYPQHPPYYPTYHPS